jgi:hypothetical protein
MDYNGLIENRMNKSAKKLMLWGSIIILLLSVGILIYSFFIPFTDTVDFIQASLVAIIMLSLLNCVFLLTKKYENRNGFRKAVRRLSWLLPVLIIVLYILEADWFPLVPDIIYGTFISLAFVFLVIACVYVFIIEDTKSIIGIVLILFYIVLALVLRRVNLTFSESHMTLSFLLIGWGMYLFGLKTFFSTGKNPFLKVVSYIACLLIFFGSLLMFYFSMTRSNTLLIVYSILVFLLTLIVLLSLPVSGYVQWSSQHKSILKKILIPWIFFLLLISIRFVFPELNSLFFRVETGEFQEFKMDDYPVINKNGLEPE